MLSFVFSLMMAAQVGELIPIDGDVAFEHAATFSANRLPYDKFLSRAKITWLSLDPETEFHDIELVTAISFKQNLVRCEKKTIDANRELQDVRRLRNKELDCFQRRTAWTGLSSSNFVDLKRLTVEERKTVSPPGFLDPYHMIVQTVRVGDPYESDSHAIQVQEYQVCNLDNVVGTFENQSNGAVVVRSYYEAPKIGAEVIFDPKQGFMPTEHCTFAGYSKADMENPKLPKRKCLLESKKRIRWKMFKEDLWLPIKIEGEYIQRAYGTEQVVNHNEFEIEIADWWVGEEVPDEVFTFQDLTMSELGQSRIQMLFEQRDSKRSK